MRSIRKLPSSRLIFALPPTRALAVSLPQDNIHQTIAGRKRFYKHVTVEPVAQGSAEYKILLDGKTLKTPGRHNLHLPSPEIAAAVALEWDNQVNQKKGIEPASMPLMILVSTAIDTIKPDPEHTINTCLKYIPTDTALFLTSAEDRILLKKQRQHFDPIVRWSRQQLGLDVKSTESIMGKAPIPTDTIEKARLIAKQMDHFELACLQSATMECKSFLMAMALMFRKLSLSEVCSASRVEEDFQTDIWGIVEGGHDMDKLNNAINLAAVDTFLNYYWADSEKMMQRLATWKSIN